MTSGSCRVFGCALALIAISAGGALSAGHSSDVHVEPSLRSRSFDAGMHEGMSRMTADMHVAAPTGNPDVDFLAMMIPHHEGAVEMARLVLVHGRDAITRKLAEDIIAGQQVEIEGMRRRLEQLRRGTSMTSPDGFPALGGTRSLGDSLGLGSESMKHE